MEEITFNSVFVDDKIMIIGQEVTDG